MKGLRYILLAALLATSAAEALSLRLSFPRFLEDADNVRLAEFFDQKPLHQTRATVYSDASSRQGYFFVAELDTALDTLPEGAQAQLEAYFAGDASPRVQKFDLKSVAHNQSSVLYLGLTSPEYRDKDKTPRILAWRISLLDTNAKTLAQAQSKLWKY
jgi:hypothetical protein